MELMPTLFAVVYFIGILQYYTNIESLFYSLGLEEYLSKNRAIVGAIFWPIVTVWTLLMVWLTDK